MTERPFARNSKENGERTRNEIRRCMSMMMRPDEIMKQLSVKKSAFYEHRAAIRKEAAKYVKDMARQDYAVYYRRTIEGFENQIQELMSIREKADNPLHKIEATRLIGEFLNDIQQTINQGPGVLRVVEQAEKESATTKLKQEVDGK